MTPLSNLRSYLPTDWTCLDFIIEMKRLGTSAFLMCNSQNYCGNKERIRSFLLRPMITDHQWFPSLLQVKEQSHSVAFILITVDLPHLVLMSTINCRLTGLVVVALIKSCTCPLATTLQITICMGMCSPKYSYGMGMFGRNTVPLTTTGNIWETSWT